jgi:hypothetical protein
MHQQQPLNRWLRKRVWRDPLMLHEQLSTPVQHPLNWMLRVIDKYTLALRLLVDPSLVQVRTTVVLPEMDVEVITVLDNIRAIILLQPQPPPADLGTRDRY